MKIEKHIEPNRYLGILTRILSAQEDHEAFAEIDCLTDVTSGEDEEDIEDIRAMLITAAHTRIKELDKEYFRMKLLYPEPPKPKWLTDFIGSPNIIIPEKPGVYFFFDCDDKIVYIGKSANLKKRLTKYHDKLDPDDMVTVSFLTFPNDELSYIESYYIGAYKPKRNFPCPRNS